jgi:hypothetical protein
MDIQYKTEKGEKKQWWTYIKWNNLINLMLIFVFVLALYSIVYRVWANSVTSPSVPKELGFTIAPGGGGKGDRLVPQAIAPTYFTRSSQDHAEINLIFGPWEKAIEIKRIEVHPLLLLKQETQIEVNISFKGRTQPIGSFSANQVKGEAHVGADCSYLLINPGETGLINIITKDTYTLMIHSDTYVWFNVLEAKYTPVDSWWGAIVSNPLSIGLLLAIFSFFAKEFVFETDNDRRQKKQIILLNAIEEHLAKQSRRYRQSLKRNKLRGR